MHLSDRQLNKPRQPQRGAVLVISLLILVVVTLIALAGSESTIFQEKMAHNLRETNTAFQSAESGLREAELWINTLEEAPTPLSAATCTSACDLSHDVWAENQPAGGNLAWQNASWWSSNGRRYGVDYSGGSATENRSIDDVNQQPRYVIELSNWTSDSLVVGGTHPPPVVNYYTVTTMGTGATDTAMAILESTFVKRFE